jgi:acyl-CoA reductase-like NAD-dependent aldehyde dehydrogenase
MNPSQQWQHESLEKRRIFERYAQQLEVSRNLLAELYTLESGKTKTTSIADMIESEHQAVAAYETIGEGGAALEEPQIFNRWAFSIPLEDGVVLAIKPPNFSAIVDWKTNPAIAAGNCVVLKEAEQTPFTAMVKTAFFWEALIEVVGEKRAKNLGGVWQLLQGPGETVGAYAVNLIKEGRAYDKLSFTGSWTTGGNAAAVAAQHIVPQKLELSGHNRILDWYDCPVETAAEEIVLAAFGDLGQRCVSTQIVFSPRKNDLVPAVIAELKKWKIGPPWRGDTKLGPFICKQYRDDMIATVEKALGENLRILIGGYPLDREEHFAAALAEGFNIDVLEFRREGFINGLFFTPTMIKDLPWDHELMRFEAFGPLLCINDLDRTYEDRGKNDPWIEEYIRARGLENVSGIHQFLRGVALMNDNLFGLSGGCLSYDLRLIGHWVRLARYGMVYRRGTTGAMVTRKTKFGGVKLSGFGREGGSVEDHTQSKQVYIHFGPGVTLAQRDK